MRGELLLDPGALSVALDEFADKLAKKLGQHYGMTDIRSKAQVRYTIQIQL